MTEKIRAYMEKYQMTAEGDTIIAGVSGGADSVCLLLILAELRERLRFDLRAVHVEHGIRGEASLGDAAFVEHLCNQKGIPCIQYSFDVPGIAEESHESLEEAGRRLRYEAFQKEAGNVPQAKIAVAHNQNDQAETMLHNLIRGSKAAGLAGMAPVRGNLIRPLLNTGRAEIEAYLRQRGQEYRTDETNQETLYTRNRIRHEILPVLEEINPAAVSHMAKAAESLREMQSYLEEQTRAAAGRCVRLEQNTARIQIAEVRKLPGLLQNQLFYRTVTELAGSCKDITERHIEELLALSGRQTGRRLDLPYGLRAVRDYDGIRLEKKSEFPPQKARMEAWEAGEESLFSCPGFTCSILEREAEMREFPKKKYTKWLDYDKIKDNLCVRRRQPGDYFYMEESGGTKKLKQYFIDEKIPAEQRRDILLVADGAHIVWIVGYRISAYYKITEHTRRILKVQYDKAPAIEDDAPWAGGNGGRKEDE